LFYLYEWIEMTAFNYKGYGRIYTNPENIQEVENIIQELDEVEVATRQEIEEKF